jgi:hypothetical protein
MHVLFLSCGQGLSIPARLAQEGHNVKTFIHNEDPQTGSGLYDRISAWRPYVNNSDLVIADDPYFGYKEIRFEKAPTHVLGLSKFFTLGSQNAGNKVALMKLTGLQLSNKTPDYYIEAWWNGRKWCTPFLELSYHWNLVSETLGPRLGPMCTVAKVTEELPQSIFEGLRNLKSIFEKSRYRGPVRLGFDQRRLADIHVGFSFDSTEIFLESMQQDPLDILLEVAGGVRSDLNMINNIYVSMRLQRIGWPTTKEHEIKGLFEANVKHCGLVNVKYQKERYYATRTFGPILKVVARGDNSKNAFTRCARTLRNITIEDTIYRIDLLDTYKTKDYPKFNEIAKIWKDTKAVSPTLVGGKSKSIPA